MYEFKFHHSYSCSATLSDWTDYLVSQIPLPVCRDQIPLATALSSQSLMRIREDNAKKKKFTA